MLKRFPLLFTLLAASFACAAPPAPEANGYEVELYFDGAPLGSAATVGTAAALTVRRIEQQADHSTDTPITLISASCDAVCTVAPGEKVEGVVTLRAIATEPGMTTLHVRVRSEVDGSEWDDAYPLAFR